MDEELCTVYWVDPEVTAASVGAIDNLRPVDGKIEVPLSTAIYLTSTRPDLFSPVPLAKAKKTASAPAPEDS